MCFRIVGSDEKFSWSIILRSKKWIRWSWEREWFRGKESTDCSVDSCSVEGSKVLFEPDFGILLFTPNESLIAASTGKFIYYFSEALSC